MRIVKGLLKLVLWCAGVALVLVLTLPIWSGPVVKTVANVLVPKRTGAAFTLGSFSLNPYVGTLSVGDACLYNPPGFDGKVAVSVGAFDVAVDMTSLAGSPVVIEDITLRDVFVAYLANGAGESNFDVLGRCARGGVSFAETESVAAGPSEPETAVDGPEGLKVVIDRLRIENALVQLGPVSVPIPNIELPAIGRETQGVTVEEAWGLICAQALQGFGAAGAQADALENFKQTIRQGQGRNNHGKDEKRPPR